MRRLLLPLLAVFALLAASCGDDDDTTAPTTTESTSTTTDPSTTDPSTPTDDPTSGWERCDNPDGFSVSYPADWHTNDGSVATACGHFDPEEFEVPDATDERVAAISAFVDDVPFHEVAPPEDDVLRRSLTTVDGHQAVRTVGPGGELYGGDTEVTRYAVDLSLGVDDGPGTLFLDTVDLQTIAYDDAVRVLDDMVRTIELDVGEDAGEQVVARYEGAAPFSGELAMQDGEPCVTTPTQGEPQTQCFTLPGSDALRAADFSGELFSTYGGVAGPDVFRVEIETDASTLSYLPRSVEGTDVRGFVVPIDGADVEQLAWYDVDGEPLGRRTIGDDAESGVEPVGDFVTPPVQSDGFPASGAPALLEDVRVAPHDGFDRVVFDFGPSEVSLSHSIEVVDEVRATSGDRVEVEGQTLLRVTMSPAAGVDLSGAEPVVTYDGPEEIRPGSTDVVTEVTEVEDFESTLTWAIGLDAGQDVAVATLDDPQRLVIDIDAG